MLMIRDRWGGKNPSVINLCRQKIGNFPDSISDSGLHRGSDPQGLVYSAEVVLGKVQAVLSPQVFPFFRERIR